MKLVIANQFPRKASHNSDVMYAVQIMVPAVKSLYKSISDWSDAQSFNKQISDLGGKFF